MNINQQNCLNNLNKVNCTTVSERYETQFHTFRVILQKKQLKLQQNDTIKEVHLANKVASRF